MVTRYRSNANPRAILTPARLPAFDLPEVGARVVAGNWQGQVIAHEDGVFKGLACPKVVVRWDNQPRLRPMSVWPWEVQVVR